jgi:hypothetical protein
MERIDKTLDGDFAQSLSFVARQSCRDFATSPIDFVLECTFRRRSDRNVKHMKQVSRVSRKNEDFYAIRLEYYGGK